MDQRPAISVRNRQRSVPVDVPRLRRHLQQALPLVERSPRGNHTDSWDELAEVDISIVSDAAIAKVHGEFMNDPSPTDVITFHHGELLVSASTAQREAKDRSTAVEDELLLYIVHGLLHLRGYDDHTAQNAGDMHALQAGIVERTLTDGST